MMSTDTSNEHSRKTSNQRQALFFVKNLSIAFFAWFTVSTSTASSIGEFGSSVVDYFKSEWELSNTSELYVPLRIWHNPAFYTKEKIKTFNETPWGLGYGKSYRDEDSNWHGYYAMLFSDSHADPEPIIGYGYIKNLIGNKNAFNAGIGYTLFITARSDYNYIPIPAVLPVASVGYKDFILNGTYIPGGKGNGNVGFFWAQFKF